MLLLAQTAKSATGRSKKPLGSSIHADVALAAILARPSSVSMAATFVAVANILSQDIGKNASSVPSAVTQLRMELQEVTNPPAQYAEVSMSSRISTAKTFVLNAQKANMLKQEKFAPVVAEEGT